MGMLKDLTNKKFGRLLVLYRAENKNNKVHWHCLCDCGNELDVRADSLISGNTQSCGCYQKETSTETGRNNFKDLTNERFGKLTVIKCAGKKNKKYYWECLCDCGNKITVVGTALTNKNTQSCGCLKSIGESNIELILAKENINYIKQYMVKIKNKIYYYDFALLENNKISRLIEFDGIQHFGRISGWFDEERSKQLKESDFIKNNYAFINKIPLVRIPYTERDNITLDLILGDKYLLDIKEAQEVDDA